MHRTLCFPFPFMSFELRVTYFPFPFMPLELSVPDAVEFSW